VCAEHNAVRLDQAF